MRASVRTASHAAAPPSRTRLVPTFHARLQPLCIAPACAGGDCARACHGVKTPIFVTHFTLKLVVLCHIFALYARIFTEFFAMISTQKFSKRKGLTLIELLVVLGILVLMAALIVPRLSGVNDRAGSAVNADLVNEVNKAVITYEAQNGTQPPGWENLVPSGDTALFTKLHPDLSSKLKVLTLDAGQAKSLSDAGVLRAMALNNTSPGLPSDGSVSDMVMFAEDTTVAAIDKTAETWSGHGSTLLDRAFNVLPTFSGMPATATPPLDEFVVLGVGQSASIRGTSMMDAPIVQSANPMQNYARVLVVYRVPPTGTDPSDAFKAKYVGAFLPDGTSAKENIDDYTTN